MSRTQYLYKGAKVVAVIKNGVLIESTPEYETQQSGIAIFTDLPDVVSPIDGTVIRGRAGMREHCKRHDVVPTADLKGLPPKPMMQPYVVPRHEREETKRYMAHLVDKMERK